MTSSWNYLFVGIALSVIGISLVSIAKGKILFAIGSFATWVAISYFIFFPYALSVRIVAAAQEAGRMASNTPTAGAYYLLEFLQSSHIAASFILFCYMTAVIVRIFKLDRGFLLANESNHASTD